MQGFWYTFFKMIKGIGILITIISGVLLLGTAGASDIEALGIEETVEKATLYTILIVIGALVAVLGDKMAEGSEDKWF